jgi:hypothetical protein
VGTRAVSLETLLQDWARHDSEHLAEMTHLTVFRRHPVDQLYGLLDVGTPVDEILKEMRDGSS